MKSQDFLDKHYLRLANEISNLSYAFRRKVGCIIVKDRQIISDGYNGTPTGFSNVCEEFVDENLQQKMMEKCQTDEEKFNYIDVHVICNNDNIDILKSKREVLHAETNAITKVAKTNFSTDGATIYITDEPCFDCAKLIIQSGIKRVVYWRDYTRHEGVELLKKANVEVVKYDNIEYKHENR